MRRLGARPPGVDRHGNLQQNSSSKTAALGEDIEKLVTEKCSTPAADTMGGAPQTGAPEEEPMVRAEEWLVIRVLAKQGASLREIARRTGRNFRTVRKAVASPEPPRYRRQPGRTQLTPYADWVVARLTAGVTRATRLYRELKPLGYPGAYPTVQRFVKAWKTAQREVATVRFETVPGQQAQVDWGEDWGIWPDGRREKVYAFCAVLGYSRRRFVTYRRRCDLWAFLGAHRAMLEYWGGVPREILYDNLKTAVLGWPGGAVRWHPTFLAFAAHYGFTPVACQPARAQTKGKTERVVGYVRHDFFVGRAFRDLADLNAQALAWCAETDERVHGTTHERPAARAATEAAALQPLPALPYDTRRVEFRVVSRDCYVSLDGTLYSVPWRWAGRRVTVKVDETRVRIFHDTTALADHPRARGRGAVVLDSRHVADLPPRRRPARPAPGPPPTAEAAVLAWAQRAFGVAVERRPLAVYDALAGIAEAPHG
jgi:transposase